MPTPAAHRIPRTQWSVPRAVRRALVVAVVVLAGTTLLAPAAQAATRTFRDGGGHLTTVKVSHTATKVGVDADTGGMRLGDYFTFWLDTDPADPGPEYRADVYPNSDGVVLDRVDSFTSAKKPVTCGGYRARADIYSSDHVVITVPRTCLRNPPSVRVAVRGFYDRRTDVVDWAPGFRQFFAPVAR